MTDGTDVFKAKISATDDASQVMAFIKNHAKQLGLQFKETGSKISHLEHKSVWDHLKEHSSEAGKSFSELGEHVDKVHEGLSELVPAFGAISAIGALGSAGALVENVEHMAEAYGELSHQAAALGVSAGDLYRWNAVAKMTDTNAESMQHSMSRLNRTLSEASSGKNRDAAALFAHLHLNPKSFHDSASALPVLAEAFKHTADATTRARMAQVLFGRAGMDMIPLLVQGRERISEMQEEADKLGPTFKDIGPGLESYNESMKKMGIATDAYRYTVAGALAPVLAPIVDDITEWTVANRQWISTGIKDEIKELGGELKRVDWHGIGDDLRGWGHYAGEFVHEIGGAKTVVELLIGAMVIKGAVFLGRETFQAAKLGIELGGQIIKLGGIALGWGRVAAAAEAAAVAERAAMTAGGAGGAAGAVEADAGGAAAAGGASAAVGAGLFAALPIAAIGTAVALKTGVDALDRATGLDTYAAAHAGANMRGGHRLDNGPRHVYGFGAGQAAAPAAAPPAKAAVTLEIKGLPAGTAVTSAGLAAPPTITRGGYTTEEH